MDNKDELFRDIKVKNTELEVEQAKLEERLKGVNDDESDRYDQFEELNKYINDLLMEKKRLKRQLEGTTKQVASLEFELRTGNKFQNESSKAKKFSENYVESSETYVYQEHFQEIEKFKKNQVVVNQLDNHGQEHLSVAYNIIEALKTRLKEVESEKQTESIKMTENYNEKYTETYKEVLTFKENDDVVNNLDPDAKEHLKKAYDIIEALKNRVKELEEQGPGTHTKEVETIKEETTVYKKGDKTQLYKAQKSIETLKDRVRFLEDELRKKDREIIKIEKEMKELKQEVITKKDSQEKKTTKIIKLKPKDRTK